MSKRSEMPKFDDLIRFLKKHFSNDWAEKGKGAFANFLSSGERYTTRAYPEAGKKLLAIRNPGTDIEQGIPYVALIQPEANPSGSYDGTSLVLFPSRSGPALLTLCIGTDGINFDAEAISRPGHARRLRAIADYLNKTYSNGQTGRVAWAKKDPCAIEQNIPEQFLTSILESDGGEDYGHAIARQSTYNPLVYFVVNIGLLSDDGLKEAFLMLMDIIMDVRGITLVAAGARGLLSKYALEDKYLPFLFPNLTKQYVKDLLEQRRFVIIQGPPGTGKTHMVVGDGGLREDYPNMTSIQFHPNMTYESFIGGLFPVESNEAANGFKFQPKPGILMTCSRDAQNHSDQKYLLHIDEINRADLSRVLGESIYLFESKEEREIELDHDYGEGYDKKLKMPRNLLIIGTMNTADKSVAPIDIAIRRRFAFVDLYPQISVVKDKSNERNKLAYGAFKSLLDVFIDYANEESFKYLPGHSYFMTETDEEFKSRMKTEIIPLLQEYLEEGLVASMATQIEDYIQQFRIICLQ